MVWRGGQRIWMGRGEAAVGWRKGGERRHVDQLVMEGEAPRRGESSGEVDEGSRGR